jgi:hypothetical protein
MNQQYYTTAVHNQLHMAVCIAGGAHCNNSVDETVYYSVSTVQYTAASASAHAHGLLDKGFELHTCLP